MTHEKVDDSTKAYWEERLGIKMGDPNFRYILEDTLANEAVDKVDEVLVKLGLMQSGPSSKAKLTKDETSWDWTNDH